MSSDRAAENPYSPPGASLRAAAGEEAIRFEGERTAADLVPVLRRPVMLAASVLLALLLASLILPVLLFLVASPAPQTAPGEAVLMLAVLLPVLALVLWSCWENSGYGAARRRLRQFPHLAHPLRGRLERGIFEAVTRDGWSQMPLEAAFGVRVRPTWIALAFDAACQQPTVLPYRAFAPGGFERAAELLRPLEADRPLRARGALVHDPRLSDPATIPRFDRPPPDGESRSPAVPFDGPVRVGDLLRTRLRRQLRLVCLRIAAVHAVISLPVLWFLAAWDMWLGVAVLGGYMAWSLGRIFLNILRFVRNREQVWLWSQGFVADGELQYAHPLGRQGVRWEALAAIETHASVVRLQGHGTAKMSWFLTREQFADEADWARAREMIAAAVPAADA